MPKASVKRNINKKKDKLIEFVLDIEKYPEFIPWCLDSKVYSFNDKDDKIEITADLTIGKSFFNETYKSFVVYDKSLDTICVTNYSGPLKYLKNKWLFTSKGNNSEVDFYIDFELKNKILNLLMTKSFDIGLKKIANAFEKRALELFNTI